MAGILIRSMMSVALIAAGLVGMSASAAQAQTAGGYGPLQISWEVRNRFRLFREERDFLLHAEAGRGRSVLASEQMLEIQSDGRGWARDTVERLETLALRLVSGERGPAPEGLAPQFPHIFNLLDARGVFRDGGVAAARVVRSESLIR